MSLFDKNVTLAEILKGTESGKMQSVGIMQVIPLTADYEDERFVSPDQAKVSTSDYGKLRFENNTDSIIIIPCNASYVVNQAAQDHAMAQLGVIEGKAYKIYDNAMCIQQSQGGLIQSAEYKMMILPFSLREAALELKDIKEYNKLWKYIDRFNRQFNITAGGELVHFFKQFEKELDQFVAEFECVPNQVGAVILINGEVVGIERTPSAKYWESVWPALIRECYGSLAIEIRQNSKAKNVPPDTKVKLRDAKSLGDLKSAIEEADEREKEIAAEKIQELFGETFEPKKEEKVAGYKVETIENQEFTGQIIRDGVRVVYGSVVATQYRMKNRSWNKESKFSVNTLINKIFN
jgi:ARG/rhodanese/phosphatase superfamily protein